MLSGVRLEALVACRRMPSRRSNLAAGRDVDVRSLCDQLTAEALLQNMPGCLCLSVGQSNSMASSPMTNPARSKLFMDRSPVRLSDVFRQAFMSDGHSWCHMNNCSSSVPVDHTPPMPSLQALVCPI
eukprot:13627462-Ditylum_brightwellii.AAC.1